MDNAPAPSPHYRRPGWLTRNVFNRTVAGATRLGVSVWGSRVLEIPGRRTGEPRRNPVNLLTFDGGTYLVSARGHTEWIRNLRANELRLTLIKGRQRTSWVAVEVVDADRTPVLRAYLARWKAEVGMFFDGVGPDSTDEELARVAADHPIFALTSTV
jgi:deazaflavin-dependent oxidoreductase (nitroreductase family)